jgi:hypothetical protein
MTIDPTTTPYSGDPNSYPETSYLPTDATRGKSQTFNVPYEALFDRTAYLRARLFDKRLLQLMQGLVISRFSPAVNPASRIGWIQTDVADKGQIWWSAHFGAVVKLAYLGGSFRGNDGPGGGHVSVPAPADRPQFRIYAQNVDGSLPVLKVTLADESTTQPEYDAHHIIGGTIVTPIEFAADEQVLIVFEGEQGANAVPNTSKLYGIEARFELA